VITEAYELGSVIKVLAALAALEEKVVTEDELIDCQHSKTAYVEGRKINTVPSSVAGIIPFTEVIEKSNNIGTAKVAMRVGTKIYDHYTRLGFGKKTGIELPGEHKGFVNHPNNWSKQSIISLSYGYEISATLLQLGHAFCLIARDGYPVKPTCVLDPKPHMPDAPSERLYSHETMEIMRRILENTTLRGTAKKAGIKGYRVMSKTGTANMLIDGQYNPTKNIFTCAGIIEKDDYQRVIVVFIKETQKKNMYASTVAAPLFERIAEKTLIHDKII
jgi:cell division protein FtsI (penicillin-binding protein 3)